MVWGRMDITVLPAGQPSKLLELTLGEKWCVSSSGCHPLQITQWKNSRSEKPVPLQPPSELKHRISTPALWFFPEWLSLPRLFQLLQRQTISGRTFCHQSEGRKMEILGRKQCGTINGSSLSSEGPPRLKQSLYHLLSALRTPLLPETPSSLLPQAPKKFM